MGLEFLKSYKNKGIRTEKKIFNKRFSAGKIKEFTSYKKEVLTNLWLEVTIKESVGNVKKTNNLIDLNKYKILSISGNTLNSSGQIKDLLKDKDFFPKKTFNVKRFLEIWNKYHLNNCTAGTLKQEEVLNNWKERPEGFSYTEDCEYLKQKGLYEDRSYKYGSSWLIKEFPQEIEEELVNLIKQI